ncbi:tRNA pseudouridine(55) synthase TruB [Salibacteraceae bacterium]|nr:tRNA pseudouridine(55) synthase TruB [Salibacteraceae bacterium]
MLKRPNFKEGSVLLVDKPITWTSFDVVNKLRYNLKRALEVKKHKVGHAGTLDPLATGLLIICTGKKTKAINEYMGLPKTYTGTITLGGTTPSYDLETEIESSGGTVTFSLIELQKATEPFVGKIQQFPPDFSAIKKNGKKSYELARKGFSADLPAREIEIISYSISTIAPSKHVEGGLDCAFEVVCSKGTYIRSLAHDLGKALGCGGFLSSLRRTAIGEYSVENALSVEETVSMIESITIPD